MCSVTIVFIRVFSSSYINSEANHILKREATEFAQILSDATLYDDNSLGLLKAKLNAKIYYFNYSMFILDERGRVIAGYNTDGIDATYSELNYIFENKIEENIGSQQIIIDDKEYSMYIKPVNNYITGQIIGYVAPFYSSQSLVSDEALITFFIFTICVAAVFSIVLGCLLTWPLTTNIYKLKKRAKLIAERKYDEYIPIKSNDEIKDLSNSIEEMVSSLKEYDQGQKTLL
mgnify:FL=1